MEVLSETVKEIRKDFAEGDQRRDAGLTTPPDIVRWDDIKYGWDSRWQILDLYRPASMAGRNLPVIVSFHGGGWVYGSKEVYQFYCMDLAKRGFAVVNFTYRLAPEFQFPAPLEDANLVFDWVLKNASRYGLNTEEIFAVGDSAGAHGLGLYAALCTNPEYEKRFAFRKPEKLKLRAIALNCGLYDLNEPAPSVGDRKELMEAYLPEHGTAQERRAVCVPEHVTSAYPPVFLMTSAQDFLKSQAPLMKARLEQMGVPHVYKVYENPEHRVGHVFHCNIKTKDATLCNDEECAFFREMTE